MCHLSLFFVFHAKCVSSVLANQLNNFNSPTLNVLRFLLNCPDIYFALLFRVTFFFMLT